MKMWIWLAGKLFFNKKSFWSGISIFSIFGLILGVASLVASMAVMSGFESSLKSAMVDVTGHVRVIRSVGLPEKWQDLEARIAEGEPELEGVAPFTFIEGIVATNGQLAGVMIQGVDADRMSQVLDFSDRIVEGTSSIGEPNTQPSAIIGKGIAKKMKLKTGDLFKVVLPISDRVDPNKFHRKLSEFKVSGVIDLGKYDWNEKMIVIDLKTAQKFAEIGDRYSGLILKFQNADRARVSGFKISQKLGTDYSVRDWYDLSSNLFDAVKIERIVIFLVVLIIVVVAAFNISSSLFVTVLKRYGDIAILKAIGARRIDIVKVFCLQGLLVGLVGVLGGFFVGYFICLFLRMIQGHFQILSGAVYKLDHIDIFIRWQDLLVILIATELICLIATLAPAIRGSKLNPVEGLRYG